MAKQLEPRLASVVASEQYIVACNTNTYYNW